MKIAIIGGGFTGLCAAAKLIKQGARVTVFERDLQLGGLATYQDYGTFYWDRYYHVILPSDKHLLTFLKDIGLGDTVKWESTKTGYYVDQKFYSVSNTREFLEFPPLRIWNKIRLAFTIYLGSWIRNWRNLEKTTTSEWLIKVGGKQNYEKFWKPLLLAKLGSYHDKVSAVFIWSYIKRLFEARKSSDQQEKLGFLSGGYKSVFDKLEKIISDDGTVLKNTTVDFIEPHAQNGILVGHQGHQEHFDKVIFTGPTSLLNKLVSPDLVKVKQDHIVEYLGVICLVLITRKELSPFYVLNLADASIPFTGVIGMSSLVNIQYTGNHYITYFPKYLSSKDPLFSKDNRYLAEVFIEGVKKLYPELNDEDIVSSHLHKASKVQPLQVVNYSQMIPSITTLHPDFFILNTSQFVNDTLNNNSVARHVNHFMEDFEDQLLGHRNQKKEVVND